MTTYMSNPSNLPLHAFQTVCTSLIREQVFRGSGCIRCKENYKARNKINSNRTEKIASKNSLPNQSALYYLPMPMELTLQGGRGGEWQVKVGWLCLNTKKIHAAVSLSLLHPAAMRNRSASCTILHLLWQPEVHYRIHSLHSSSIFSSETQSLSPLLDIHGGTTLTSASTCYYWSRHFRVYNYKLERRMVSFFERLPLDPRIPLSGSMLSAPSIPPTYFADRPTVIVIVLCINYIFIVRG